MGSEEKHDHNFACPKCGEELVIQVTAKNAFDISIDCILNCEQSDAEGQVLNLAADFLIRKEHLHTDTYFPSMEHMHHVIPHVPMDEILGKTESEEVDLSKLQERPVGMVDDWARIRKAYRQITREHRELAEEQLVQYQGAGLKGSRTFHGVLFNFAQRFLAPRAIQRFVAAAAELQGIEKAGPDEYARFVRYYDSELRTQHLDRYMELLSEYFRDFDEFNQTLVYAKIEIAVPDGLVAKSVGFPRTKMFYGNAFESHGSNVIVVACLNNIRLGRHFDQFEKMDLRQYRSINKAGRTNPFSNFEPFHALAEEYDSTIRNASHHGWFRLDASGEYLEYRSGGTGAAHRMRYAEYLLRCNRLFLSALALLCLELVIGSAAGLID